MMTRTLGLPFLALLFSAACGGNGVSSSEKAKEAYLGLDAHIDKAITLGFDGFNTASSANISPQMVNGDSTGTLTVTGQVDQGASSNKTMRLLEAMAMYSDDGKHTYDTDSADPPMLNMDLQMIPTGTLSGTLDGPYTMSGALKGTVTLAITFNGTLMAGASNAVERAPGTTHITGTATSPFGTYDIDITR